MEATDIDDGQSLQGASPEADAQVNCAYSGERAPRSEMFQLDGCWITLEHREAAVVFTREGGRLPRVWLESASAGCLKVGHLLRRTRKVLSTGGLSACWLFLLVKVPARLLIESLAGFIHNGDLTDVLLLLAQSLALGGCMFWLRQHGGGSRPEVSQGLAAAFGLFPGVILTQLLFLTLFPNSVVWVLWLGDRANEARLLSEGLPDMLGLAVIALTFYLLTRTVLSVAAMVDQRAGGLKGIQKSWMLTKGHCWRTFVLVTLPTVGMIISPRLLAPVARLVSAPWPARVITCCTLELLSIPIMAFITCYYMELKALHEARAQN